MPCPKAGMSESMVSKPSKLTELVVVVTVVWLTLVLVTVTVEV